MRSPLGRAALLALALLVPIAARAHGVEIDVDRSAAGIAVRGRYHGGRPLAGATYEVVSPAAPGRAHDAGTTDRHGWLVFVPDAPGTWTVRVVDASGHGKVEKIDVPAEAVVAAAEDPAGRAGADASAPVGAGAVQSAADAAAASPASAPPSATPPLSAADARAKAGSIYRVVGGLAVIGLVFVVLFAVMLRRKSAGR